MFLGLRPLPIVYIVLKIGQEILQASEKKL